MKINSNAFGAPGAAAEKKLAADGETPAPASFGRKPPAPETQESAGAPTDQEIGAAAPSSEPQAVERISLFTRPAKTPVKGADHGDEAAAEAVQSPSDPKSKKLTWAWRRKPVAPKVGDQVSAARLPNKSRPMLIVAGVFVVGAILGPWLAQKSAPAQPQAAGPNPAVQAVADTLNGGTFGAAPRVAGLETPVAGPASDEVALPSAVAPQVQIPALGEDRYTAMLQQMKSGDGSASQPVTVVPKINPALQPSRSGEQESYKPVDVYPKVAIPLEIEKSTTPANATADLIQIERNVSPTGRYVVLRIERNPEGILAALLMPLGGRQAIDSAWVFVGDATSDGMVVENIVSNSVIMRTTNGRSIQIALN